MAIKDKEAEAMRIQIAEMQGRWKEDAKKLLAISCTHNDDFQPEVRVAVLETIATLETMTIARLPGEKESFEPKHYISTGNPLKGFV